MQINDRLEAALRKGEPENLGDLHDALLENAVRYPLVVMDLRELSRLTGVPVSDLAEVFDLYGKSDQVRTITFPGNPGFIGFIFPEAA